MLQLFESSGVPFKRAVAAVEIKRVNWADESPGFYDDDLVDFEAIDTGHDGNKTIVLDDEADMEATPHLNGETAVKPKEDRPSKFDWINYSENLRQRVNVLEVRKTEHDKILYDTMQELTILKQENRELKEKINVIYAIL
jgi:hypothetical protein